MPSQNPEQPARDLTADARQPRPRRSRGAAEPIPGGSAPCRAAVGAVPAPVPLAKAMATAAGQGGDIGTSPCSHTC